MLLDLHITTASKESHSQPHYTLGLMIKQKACNCNWLHNVCFSVSLFVHSWLELAIYLKLKKGHDQCDKHLTLMYTDINNYIYELYYK